MKRIVEYKIVHDQGAFPLSEKVNQAISEGWQLVGGISSFDMVLESMPLGEQHSAVWAQALVRYED